MSNNICQFYVIIGDSMFRGYNDGNVYINITTKYDYKEIQDEIFRVYKEKAKLGIKVASEIVFLVGGISDSERAKDVINKLRLKGRIEVIKREEKKQLVEKKEDDKIPERELVEKKEVRAEFPQTPVMPPVREDFLVVENKVDNVIEKERNFLDIDKKEEKVDNTNEVKLPDNVYKRDIEFSNYNSYIGKPIDKKEKLNKLPLIIFIISLILFVGSVVLLFVL